MLPRLGKGPTHNKQVFALRLRADVEPVYSCVCEILPISETEQTKLNAYILNMKFMVIVCLRVPPLFGVKLVNSYDTKQQRVVD